MNQTYFYNTLKFFNEYNKSEFILKSYTCCLSNNDIIASNICSFIDSSNMNSYDKEYLKFLTNCNKNYLNSFKGVY